MSVESTLNTVKTFEFSFPSCTNKEMLYRLEVPLEIPHQGSIAELVHRVMKMFHIPVYLEDDIYNTLAEFVSKETKTFHNDHDEMLLNQLKNSDINVEGIIKGWEKLFKDHVVEYAEQKGTSDEEVFAAAYHKLVHSPALETILQVEGSYAATVAETINNRDQDIDKMTARQTEEMEKKVRLVDAGTTEEEVNSLSAAHFEQQSLVSGRWASQLDALRQTQRAHHRAWLMDTLEEYHTSAQLNTPSNSPLGTFTGFGCAPPPPTAPATAAPDPAPRLEESFTIHLGSQLKQTHNIRIVAMDMMDLVTLDHHNSAESSSRRMQTSLGLYSSSLSGVVLLADCPPARPSDHTLRLVRAASASTEHHFPDVDQQLRCVDEKVKEPLEKRHSERVKQQAEQASSASTASKAKCYNNKLSAGDVFITRHSNLADVHVVFHLMVNDTELQSGDITSRHPAILGLRNILRAATDYDVTTIALPLLLSHTFTETMTSAWCGRRAELVLKCVKGFMLETADGGGAELTTLTLVAPPNVAPTAFAALTQLLPQVFRLNNPLKLHHANVIDSRVLIEDVAEDIPENFNLFNIKEFINLFNF